MTLDFQVAFEEQQRLRHRKRVKCNTGVVSGLASFLLIASYSVYKSFSVESDTKGSLYALLATFGAVAGMALVARAAEALTSGVYYVADRFSGRKRLVD